MFDALSILAGGTGILLTAALAGAMVLVWDWRFALPALMVVQISVSALVVNVHGVPAQWAVVQVLIVGLCAVMLAMSGFQAQIARSGRHSGSWFFRLMVLLLVAAALRSLGLQLSLPVVNPQISLLLGWLAVMAMLIFGLGDGPMFTAIALLLWCSLGHAVASVLAPIAEVVALVGLVQLALGLTCSYLIVAERLPRLTRRAVISDVSFPAEMNSAATIVTAAPAAPLPAPAPAFPPRPAGGARAAAPPALPGGEAQAERPNGGAR
jgi:hypothetical protein